MAVPLLAAAAVIRSSNSDVKFKPDPVLNLKRDSFRKWEL